MAYMGTAVAAGKAGAVVVATGMDTELGRIAGMLQRQESEPTPLQRRLAELGQDAASTSCWASSPSSSLLPVDRGAASCSKHSCCR